MVRTHTQTTPIYRAPYNQTPPEFKTTKPQYPLPKQLPETMCIHTNSNPTEKKNGNEVSASEASSVKMCVCVSRCATPASISLGPAVF